MKWPCIQRKAATWHVPSLALLDLKKVWVVLNVPWLLIALPGRMWCLHRHAYRDLWYLSGTERFKNVSNHWNTKISPYLETSGTSVAA